MSAPAPVLYAENGVRVTPSWIGVDDVSHAVRTVVRLRRLKRGRERVPWTTLCATMAVLALTALVAALRGALPFALAWSAFAAALGFALLAGWYAFVAADRLGVEIALADGTTFEAPARDARQLERLHAALCHALDWHGGTAVVPPATPSIAPAPAPSADQVVRVVDRDGSVV